MNDSKNKALPKTGGQKQKGTKTMKQYSLFKNNQKIKCKPVFKKVTPFAGVFSIIRFAEALGVSETITKYLKIKKRKRGYSEFLVFR